MKTRIISLILVVIPFWTMGQEQKVEVSGFFVPGYRLPLHIDTTSLCTKFIGLFKEDEKFHLKQTEGHYKEEYNDCLEESFIYLIPNEENCIFLFSDFTGYNTLPIDAINGGKEIEMMPGKSFNFNYNNIVYTFQAEGEIAGSDIKNYTLSYAKTDSPTKQTLVIHELIESTVVSILFIGDIDGDGEPDIILNATNHYEFLHIQLFLSSTKKKNELLHLEGEITEWSDC